MGYVQRNDYVCASLRQPDQSKMDVDMSRGVSCCCYSRSSMSGGCCESKNGCGGSAEELAVSGKI